MSILIDGLESVEQLPLMDTGVQVWFAQRQHSNEDDLRMKEFRRLLMTKRGLTCSTESILSLLSEVMPTIMGIDMYRMPPGISINASTLITMPEHWWCKTFVSGSKPFEFILVAKGLIKNCKDVYDRTSINTFDLYDNGYAYKFTEVSEETILDITKDERSTSAVGAFIRKSGVRWRPLQIADAQLLSYRTAY